jgi:hypothetical protein
MSFIIAYVQRSVSYSKVHNLYSVTKYPVPQQQSRTATAKLASMSRQVYLSLSLW